MEPILVYGYPFGSSMGLVAAFEWRGQPYRLCRVDMLGEMRRSSFARLNGRYETPVLITEDGRPVSETLAIAAWMEARDPLRTISFEPQAPDADRMRQLMAFLNTGFTGAFSALWTALEMEASNPDYQAALRRFGRDAVIERHDKLEQMAGDGPFLVGERPTLADALLIGVARWLDFHQVAEPERWPRVHSIRRRLEADPAVLFATALESGEFSAGSGALKSHVPLDELISGLGPSSKDANT